MVPFTIFLMPGGSVIRKIDRPIFFREEVLAFCHPDDWPGIKAGIEFGPVEAPSAEDDKASE